MRLLLLSNSTNAGEGYLEYAKAYIRQFIGPEKITILFIPYAAVTFSWDDYSGRVREKMNDLGYDIAAIHQQKNAAEAVKNARIIMIGGGNTFFLLSQLQKNNILLPIRDRIKKGTPYIGWSAGSNIACPTICTTNDMPIVEPGDFKALNLLNFQINPHYTDANPENFAGETREARIQEFITVNPGTPVVGLREGTALQITGNHIELLGNKTARYFINGKEPAELDPANNMDFLSLNA